MPLGKSPVGVGLPSFVNTSRFFVGAAYPWASSYDLSSYPGAVHRDGVRAMRDVVAAVPDVVLIGLAPFTNLASLFDRFPALDTSRVRVFAMSGSIYRGYDNATPVTTQQQPRLSTLEHCCTSSYIGHEMQTQHALIL